MSTLLTDADFSKKQVHSGGKRSAVGALERRKQILSVLSQRRQDTYKNLSHEFNVSTKTIQNDILELSMHYPIETIQGKGGGVRMQEGYCPDCLRMTFEQTNLCRKLAAQLEGKELEVMHSIIRQFGSRYNFFQNRK